MIRSANTVVEGSAVAGAGASRAASAAGRGWLFGPWWDLFFVANVAWPIVLLAPLGDSFGGQAGVQFWQLYYVTTPHRWITLFIVFLDRERFGQRKLTFVTLAVAAVTICLGVWLATGALTCLLAIDYVWNAWHFASQHHGVYRIYGHLSASPPTPPGRPDLEKWSLRVFLLYVILRVVSVTWPDAYWNDLLAAGDWAAAMVPAWLIGRELMRSGSVWTGRFGYLTSVSCLYLAMLWAVHTHRPGLVLSLATASALFHAIEYLTLVSWSVRQRHAAISGQMGLLGQLVPRWGIALAVFVLVLGAGGWFLDKRYLEAWLFANVVIAFLHYAYDGLIWRRRPATSAISAQQRVYP